MVDWHKYLREVCSTELLANPVVIGGPDHVVAIDESVVARRKPGNAQGRPVPAMWVFGDVDTTTKDFFMQIVPRRDAQTLLPIITRHIAAGSTIWSDEWAAYSGLAGLNGYAHSTVNNSQRFVDPVTGVHTNDIESRWRACKAVLKKRRGVARHIVPDDLDEYMWRCRR